MPDSLFCQGFRSALHLLYLFLDELKGEKRFQYILWSPLIICCCAPVLLSDVWSVIESAINM